MPLPPWECDLPGCERLAEAADDDERPPVPPDGWLAVRLHRRDWVLPLELDYCSDSHMRQHLADVTLPGPDPRHGERR